MAGPTQPRAPLQPPPRVAPSAGASSVALRSRAEINDGVGAVDTPVAGRPSEPRDDASFEAYQARRSAAVAPLEQEASDDDARAAQLRASGDRVGAVDAQSAGIIARTNAQLTTPDWASPTGDFVPGDLRGFTKDQWVDNHNKLAAQMGEPQLSGEAADAAAEENLAKIPPASRTQFWTIKSAEYQKAKADSIAQDQIRQRVGGKTGDALANAYMAFGGFGSVTDAPGAPGAIRAAAAQMRTSLRPTPAAAPAPSAGCATCSAPK